MTKGDKVITFSTIIDELNDLSLTLQSKDIDNQSELARLLKS